MRTLEARLDSARRGMTSAVAVKDGAGVEMRTIGGTLYLWKYAPQSLGSPSRTQLYHDLCDRAAAKLGYTRDKRCRSGWRHNSFAEEEKIRIGMAEAEARRMCRDAED
jgi:hypothetical protein